LRNFFLKIFTQAGTAAAAKKQRALTILFSAALAHHRQ
jgi:hypothetical protein